MGTLTPPADVSHRRQLSRSLVLAELASQPALSQPQLVQRTGLARATVAAVVTDLLEQGTITYGDRLPGRGRPARLLVLAPPEGHLGAIDLGHSHVAVAVADARGEIVGEERAELDVDDSATAAFDLAADLLARCRRAHDVGPLAAIGAGVPGPVERTSGSIRSGTVLRHWTGVRPRDELARRLGDVPLRVENDAHLSALGEYMFGVAQGVPSSVFVKVASGIGAGTILNGELYRGAHGTAGEIGHVQVREEGVLCRCGGRGCLETVASTTYARQALQAIHGPDLTLEGVRRLIESGDPSATRLAHDVGISIGRVLAVLTSHLDPELVVVGGPLIDDPGPFIEGIATTIRHRTQPYVGRRVDVVGSTLKDRVGLLGGVALALETARQQAN